MKIYYMFILVFIISQLSFSQIKSGEFVYKVTNTSNLNSLISKYKDSTSLQKKIINKIAKDNDEEMLGTEFILTISDSIASYKLIDKMDINDNKLNIGRISAKASGDFYFDFNNNLVINSFEYKGKKFDVVDSLASFKWKITKESKTIGGYICFKALGIQKSYFSSTDKTFEFPLEAWFTPEIPISAGPEGKGGLPGLIMVLKLKTKIYYISSVKTEIPVEKIKIPNKRIISRIDYNKIKRNIFLTKS